MPRYLQKVVLPVVDPDVCRAAYRGRATIQPTETICAGFAHGGRATCAGDSGGPLVVRFGPTGRQLIGLVSFGMRSGTDPRVCALDNGFSVFTRVAAFYDWIIETVRRN